MQNDNTKFHDKQFLALTVGKIAGLLLTFAIPVFLSRFLSKSDYGVYAQFNMFEGLLAGVLNCSMGSGLYYFYARLTKRQFCSMVGNCFAGYLFLCLIGYLFLRLTPCGELIMGNSPVINIMNLLFIATFCTLCTHLMSPFYVVTEDNRIALLYPTLEIIIRCTATITIACAVGGLKGVIAGIMAARGLTLLFVISYMVIKSRNWLQTSNSEKADITKKQRWYDLLLNWKIFVKQFRYTIPLAVSATLGVIVIRLDKIICVSYMDSAEYAIYAVAFLAIPGISQVQSSIAEVCLTGMSRCFKNNDPHGALELLKQLEYKALSFSTPLVFAAILYADHAISFIYSAKYIDSAPYFRVFILSTLFEMVASGLITRASGNTKISLYTSIVSFIITLPVTFFAVKSYGAWGGIFSVLITSLVQRFAYVFYEIRIVDANLAMYLPWRKLGKIFAASLLAGAPFAILRLYYNFNMFISGLLAVIYIISVYYIEMRMNTFIVGNDTAVKYINGILHKLKSLFLFRHIRQRI